MQEQEGGVVAQAAGLMVEHRACQAPQYLFCRLAAGGFALEQVREPVQAKNSPSGVRASVTPSV